MSLDENTAGFLDILGPFYEFLPEKDNSCGNSEQMLNKRESPEDEMTSRC